MPSATQTVPYGSNGNAKPGKAMPIRPKASSTMMAGMPRKNSV